MRLVETAEGGGGLCRWWIIMRVVESYEGGGEL